MNIPKDMIIWYGAIVIAGALAAAVPAPTISNVESSPEQRTSHPMPRSGGVDEFGGGSIGNIGRRLDDHRDESGATSAIRSRPELDAYTAISDTLRQHVVGGEVLIIGLPEELDGRPVGNYSLLRAPALSWLVDYSFMWRTLPQDAGSHNVLLGIDGRADTLVVTILVQ